MNLQKSCLLQDFPLRAASHPCFMAFMNSLSLPSPLLPCSVGCRRWWDEGMVWHRWDEGDRWDAGPCVTAAVGLSEAGGDSWLGCAGGAGEPASQMGSRWLVLAFLGLRSELLITHSPLVPSSPPPSPGTPPRCVASPPRAGPAASKALLACW